LRSAPWVRSPLQSFKSNLFATAVAAFHEVGGTLRDCDGIVTAA
jgi:hypothetical protein